MLPDRTVHQIPHLFSVHASGSSHGAIAAATRAFGKLSFIAHSVADRCTIHASSSIFAIFRSCPTSAV